MIQQSNTIQTMISKVKIILGVLAAVYVLSVTAAAAWLGLSLRRSREESARLAANQESLLSDIETYRTRDGRQAAEVERLQLSLEECREALSSGEDIRRVQSAAIASLRVKLRRLEDMQTAAVLTAVDTVAEFVSRPFSRDTLPRLTAAPRTPVSPAAGTVEWSDPWVSLRVRVEDGKAAVSIASADTLIQVAHRVPRRFLGIPFGTRGIRQEIVSTNPHSRVVYAEYIELRRK